MHFMSIEVAAQQFLFIPADSTDNSSDLDEFRRARKREKEMAETDVPFFHNHLHDLESLWWVTVWVVFYRSFSDGTAPRSRLTLEDAKDQLDLAEKLFPPVSNSTARRDSFQIAKLFRETCNKLPHDKEEACFGLDFLRHQLIKHYMAIEANYPLINQIASTDDIYDDFIRTFKDMKSRYHGFALESIQETFAELLKPEGKRPRSESTNDTGAAQKNPRK